MATGRDRLNEEVGSWLAKMGSWDVYFTGTWSKPVSMDGCVYGMRRYLDWVKEASGQQLKVFWGIERGPNGGHLHVHGLIGNVAHMKAYCGARLRPGLWGVPCCMMHAWPWGICRMEPYDPLLGASHYVGKYVSKNLAEWQIVGDMGQYQLVLFRPPTRREVTALARGAGPKRLQKIRESEAVKTGSANERREWWKDAS